MSSALECLQDAIADRLAAIPEIVAAQIAVVSQRKGHLETQAKEALAKVRACIVVYPPSGSIQYPNAPGPHLQEISLQVTIAVFPERYAGPSALELAELALRYLHHYRTPEGAQILAASNRPNPDPVDHSQYNIVDTFFVSSFGLAPLAPLEAQ